MLLAGFPCQSFCTAISRERRATHPTRDFYEVVLAAIAHSECTRLVLENVPTLITAGGGRWEALCHGLCELGFALDHAVLDAKDFGLPQARRRLYVVGRRAQGAMRPLADYAPRAAALRDIVEGGGR